MTIEWIEKEEEKWIKEIAGLTECWNKYGKYEGYQSELTRQFSEYIEMLNNMMFSYWIGSLDDYDKLPKEDKETLANKHIIHEGDKKIIPIRFEYTFGETQNGGTWEGRHDTIIYLNPNSAFMFYNTYREFLNGNLKGVRTNIDYENIDIFDYEKINELSNIELLYWCFVHQVTFEEFSKMTLIHECSHHYGLTGDGEPKINKSIIEGMTEVKSRKFARDNHLPYLPVYRQRDYLLVTKLLSTIIKKYNNPEEAFNELLLLSLTWDVNPNFYCCNYMIHGINEELTDFSGLDELDSLYQDDSAILEKMNLLLGNRGPNSTSNIKISFIDYFEFENIQMNVDALLDKLMSLSKSKRQ